MRNETAVQTPHLMRVSNLFRSCAFLVCVVLAVFAQGVSPANRFSHALFQSSKEQADDREIAERFAPVFYQALGDKPRSDYITNFDFDGDWRGDNNWEHTDEREFPLRAYIYYAVSETQTHYFIHYAVFHPRDYKGGERKGVILSDIIREGTRHGKDHDPTGWMAEAGVAHENDMEGALIVVAKNGNDLDRGRVVYLETFHHNDFSPFMPGESAPRGIGSYKTEGMQPLLYVEPKGHGIEAYSGDEKQTARKTFLIYKFTGKAEDPDLQHDGAIGYELLPIQLLWQKASVSKKDKDATYADARDYGQISISLVQPKGSVVVRKIKLGELGSAFVGDTGGLNMARPPWAWFDKDHRDDPPGLWFFDPARVVKRDFPTDESFSTTYVRLPFWASAR